MPDPDGTATILVVDDTPDILELVSVVLTRDGFRVLVASGGAEMDATLARNAVDLIVLDTMMPDEDGLAICKRLQQRSSPPILMLSARAEDIDRIKGLDLGAEDYMAKPFNPKELVARIRVILRRADRTAAQLSEGARDRFFGWSLDARTRRLTSPDDKYLVLSTAEYAVLRVLLDQPDRPLKRDLILSRMAELHEDSTPRALDTIVSRLRRKLTYLHPQTGGEDLIRTVYGVGYMMKPADG